MTTKRAKILAGEGVGLPSRVSYSDDERPGIHAQKVRLAQRHEESKDWDGKADNDNIAWPLATSLIREGNKELLKVAFAYRRIYDQAKSEAVLGGRGVVMGEGFALDRYTYLTPKGDVAYKHARQRTAADVDIPARQYKAPPKSEDVDLYSNNPTGDAAAQVKNWSKVPKPWNGDKPVNDMIDAQAMLSRLQSRLGHLCEPLEMSVIDGATYREVGNSLGVSDRSGSTVAGRTAVHLALITLRDAMGTIKREDLAA